LKQAEVVLEAANAPSFEDWRGGKEWAQLQEQTRLTAEAAFGLSKIRW